MDQSPKDAPSIVPISEIRLSSSAIAIAEQRAGRPLVATSR